MATSHDSIDIDSFISDQLENIALGIEGEIEQDHLSDPETAIENTSNKLVTMVMQDASLLETYKMKGWIFMSQEIRKELEPFMSGVNPNMPTVMDHFKIKMNKALNVSESDLKLLRIAQEASKLEMGESENNEMKELEPKMEESSLGESDMKVVESKMEESSLGESDMKVVESRMEEMKIKETVIPNDAMEIECANPSKIENTKEMIDTSLIGAKVPEGETLEFKESIVNVAVELEGKEEEKKEKDNSTGTLINKIDFKTVSSNENLDVVAVNRNTDFMSIAKKDGRIAMSNIDFVRKGHKEVMIYYWMLLSCYVKAINNSNLFNEKENGKEEIPESKEGGTAPQNGPGTLPGDWIESVSGDIEVIIDGLLKTPIYNIPVATSKMQLLLRMCPMKLIKSSVEAVALYKMAYLVISNASELFHRFKRQSHEMIEHGVESIDKVGEIIYFEGRTKEDLIHAIKEKDVRFFNKVVRMIKRIVNFNTLVMLSPYIPVDMGRKHRKTVILGMQERLKSINMNHKFDLSVLDKLFIPFTVKMIATYEFQIMYLIRKMIPEEYHLDLFTQEVYMGELNPPVLKEFGAFQKKLVKAKGHNNLMHQRYYVRKDGMPTRAIYKVWIKEILKKYQSEKVDNVMKSISSPV